VAFIDLFDSGAPVPVVVVHFVALLELVKEGLVQIMQEENFAPIYARLATAEDALTAAGEAVGTADSGSEGQA
jgi:chromatin segregation and condensation protein Rec8/ScpA/Scc1 (kleisin family)